MNRSRSGHCGSPGRTRRTFPYRQARISAQEKLEPIWEEFAREIISSEVTRMSSASARSCSLVTEAICSVQHRVGEIRVPLAALQPKIPQANGFQGGGGFAGPFGVVQLVER